MRTEFQGVALDRFCETDRERIAGMSDEMVGIAGLCRRCTRVLDEAALARGEFVGWNENPSRAVVCTNSDGDGLVLWWVGLFLYLEISEAGMRTAEDLGLTDAPIGVSIWEGIYRTVTCGNPLDGYDYETEPVGTYRRPTTEEMTAICDGRAPWDERDWWAKSLPPEEG